MSIIYTLHPWLIKVTNQAFGSRFSTVSYGFPMVSKRQDVCGFMNVKAMNASTSTVAPLVEKTTVKSQCFKKAESQAAVFWDSWQKWTSWTNHKLNMAGEMMKQLLFPEPTTWSQLDNLISGLGLRSERWHSVSNPFAWCGQHQGLLDFHRTWRCFVIQFPSCRIQINSWQDFYLPS